MTFSEEAGRTAMGRSTKVVVATTVMLSFISFWRAAAIVLSDLGSSAFYAAGIAEQAVGAAAPWFILGVMLFSYAVRAIYIESCAMFTRGGVYRVVKEAMGGTLAKLSVSALMFDYILTGPISGVSAGQYIVVLFSKIAEFLGHPWNPSKHTIDLFSASMAVVATLYFWWRNTKGIHESSNDALRIMYLTTVMAVILIVWSTGTILLKPEAQRLPPLPIPHNLHFNQDAVGWFPNLTTNFLKPDTPPSTGQSTIAVQSTSGKENHYSILPNAGMLFGLIGLLIAFGHSILAMSGEETLAQVNRELEHPKHKNLMRAGMVIFVYSLLFTSLVAFFAYALIPNNVRAEFSDNLISGIALNLAGPKVLRLLFQTFIVFVGGLLLFGAVNTAIIGSNAVLNRISEDGVLTEWFRAPHKKYGTSYRLINLVVILQLLTILCSRGDVYVLGEAYAFGVVWSFAFKGLAVLILRFKDKSPREWKVPFNLNIKNNEIAVGLGAIAALLFSIAGINLITKQVATVSGIAFTLVFFLLFVYSERANQKKRGSKAHVEMDHFRLQPQDNVSTSTVEVRPGNSLCLVRDYTHLDHVHKAIQLTPTQEKDLVVMTIHLLRGPDAGYHNLNEHRLFTDYEQLLFSRVVALAEKEGKPVELLVVPASNVFQAIAQTATQLRSSEIILGASAVISPAVQAGKLGVAWEQLPNKPRHQVLLKIMETDGTTHTFSMGAHIPHMTEEDIHLIHSLWLDMVKDPKMRDLHHRDVVALALQRLERDLKQTDPQKLLLELHAHEQETKKEVPKIRAQ
jgi:amino acid transporter